MYLNSQRLPSDPLLAMLQPDAVGKLIMSLATERKQLSLMEIYCIRDTYEAMMMITISAVKIGTTASYELSYSPV